MTGTSASGSPSLSTPTAASITNNSATLGATITGDGGNSITARGTVYKTSSPVADTDNPLAEGGTATGAFSHARTGLDPQTQYFYAGYATNSSGTSLSAEGNFRTLSNPPTAQATGLSGTATSQTAINLNWTTATFPGSGATTTGYALLRATSPNTPSLSNSNGAAPAAGANTTIVSSTILGSATTASAAGLSASTTYNFLLVPFCWDGTNAATYNYLTASAPTASATTFSPPSITVNPTSVSFGQVVSGTNSGEQSYTASGSNLTANISITAPAGVEISLTSGSYTGTPANTLTLTQSGGTVSSTTIYARYTASATGTISGNIAHSSTGATTQNVAIGGTVLATEPTQQGAPVVNSVTSSSIVISGYSTGNGTNVLIVAKQGSAVDAFPADGTGYTRSNTFGSGTNLGSNNYAVAIGTLDADPVTISGLSPATTYHFACFEYNGSGTTANYLTTNPGVVSATTLATTPTASPTALTFSSVTANSMTVGWTAAMGSPAGYIVLYNSGTTAPNTSPTSGTAYTVGATIGNATVAYVGSDVSFLLTGLTDNTQYNFRIHSYNGSGSTTAYRTTSPLTGNQTTSSVAAPVATAATDLAETSFTANWNAVSGATGYRLDVSTSSTFGTAGTGTETFTAIGGGTSSNYLTRTWTGIGGNTWTAFKARTDQTITASNDAITLQDASAAYILSGEIANDPTNVSFDIQQKFGGSNGNVVLKILSGTGFTTVTTIGTYSYSTTASNVSAPISGISGPFKIQLENGNTSVRPCIDNMAITTITPNLLPGYNNLSVSGTSQSVTGLTGNTTYYYRARAVGANSTSSNSNVISATTTAACTPSTWYADSDGDTYGNPSVSQSSCTQPGGYVADNTDCNDGAAAINPGATEIAGDNIDQNCDGAETCYTDADDDGYRPGTGTATVNSTDTDCNDANEAVSGDPTGDCNDGNAAVNPGATETCNTTDDDCDGSTDEGVQTVFYQDSDGDTYGNSAVSQMACTQPGGYVANSTDCNDGNANINPGITEQPGNNIDQNCDGVEPCYTDADDDGYRPDASSTTSGNSDADCNDPFEALASDPTTDCNDANAAVKPGATEVCNTIDDDCDLAVDEGVQTTFYQDSDGDTYGNAAVSQMACTQPGGYVSNSTDCNDAVAAINPGATEIAGDNIDQNCDGAEICYTDADNDGYRPSTGSSTTAGNGDADCNDVNEALGSDPTGDCNDANAAIKPGATELCNGIDDNCDGTTEPYAPNTGTSGINESYAVVAGTFYDLQNATGNPDFQAFNLGQFGPGGTLTLSGGQIKTFKNGAANICGGKLWYSIYPASGSPTVWNSVSLGFQSDLGGGNQQWGTTSNTTNILSGLGLGNYKIAVYVSASGGASGGCATDPLHVQNNTCANWVADFTVCTTTTYYQDADGDSYGNASVSQSACGQPTGYVTDNTDCNDGNNAIRPNATEITGDNIDQNCNNQEICFTDADNDGYYLPATVTSTDTDCNDTGEGALSETAGDCNDSNSAINAGATEIAGDEIDQNCDNAELCFADADNDGYRTTSTVASTDTDCDDAGEAETADPAGDCNDANNAIRPNATELAGDNIDQNCDGAEICYTDADNDGYRPGTGTSTVNSTDADCNDANEAVSGDPTGDCNDAASGINPGATEIAGDNIDQNCDGAEICFADADDDGYRPGTGTETVNSTDTDCNDANEAISSDPTGDCNDANAAIKPGATELVNDGVDQNCDNIELCYADADNDGYRPDANTTVNSSDLDCDDSGEAIAADPTGDCNDANANIRPNQADYCNGMNDDCDGSTDEDGGGPNNSNSGIYESYVVVNDVFYDLQNATANPDFAAHAFGNFATNGNLEFSGGEIKTYKNGGADICGGKVWYSVYPTGGSPATWVSVNLGFQNNLGGGDQQWGTGANTTNLISGLAAGTYQLAVYVSASGNAPSQASCGCDPFHIQNNGGAYWVANFSVCNTPSLSASETDVTCANLGAIDLTVSGGSSPFTFAWTGGATSEDLTNLAAGDYTVTVTATGGCTVSATYTVGAIATPTFTATPANANCSNNNGSIAVTASGGSGTGYEYSKDGGTNYQLGSTFGGLAAGTYSVRVKDSNGCQSPASNVTVGTTVNLTFYQDSDGDTYGNPAVSQNVCAQPSGYVSNNTDCNDANAAVNPAATEVCNSIDDDCDVSVDEGLTQYTYYADADGDTYGNPGVSQTTCQSTAPTGYVTDNTDCNDATANVRPGLSDYCNGVDNDCDGNTDEDGANPNNSNSGIFESYVVINDVFYDLQNATANPDFPAFNFGSIPTTGTLEFSGGEIKTYKNGGADICGGKIWYSIYPSAGSPTTWVPVNLPFAENLSNPGDQRWATTAGMTNLANGLSVGSYKIAVYVSASGNASGQTACACDPYHVQPGNGLYWVADFAVCQAFTYYADADGDTYGNASVSQSACSAPSGYVSNNTDCNDANAAINPAATEICDASDVDEDCDGNADDNDTGGAAGKTNWYADGDMDTFGAGAATLACNQPVGQVSNNTDCNDGNAAIRPNATELAGDNVDQNCDGAEICFTDADDDGYRPGTGTATVNSTDADCNDANEAISSDPTGDCNDSNGAIRPNATEQAGDNVDQNCDGAEICFTDADDDGYRPGTGTATVNSTDADCNDANEAISSDPTGDCNDSNAAIKPGATEQAGDNVDQNCDGAEICFTDADDDGYRPGTGTSTVNSTDTDCNDANEALASDPTGDCDDSNDAIRPNATEQAGDNVDQNCDGAEICFADADNDGYRPGIGTATVNSTDADCNDANEAISSDPTGDCNDSNDAIRPNATEQAGDNVDQNCDGAEICFTDADDDGYRPGTGTATVNSTDADCNDANEAISSDPTGDCNDSNDAIRPNATEQAGDNIDQNCDGAEICYVDADDDGYRPGTGTATVNSTDADCNDPFEALASDPTNDCNDANPAINPGATEICNGIDDNCNGITDLDNVPPTAVCHVNVTIAVSGTNSNYAAQINDGSSDNCTPTENLVFTTSPASLGCAQIGQTITATLTVADLNGNTADCTSSVTIEDGAPTAVCKNTGVALNAAGMASLAAADVNNGSFDQCGSIVSMAVSPNMFDCNDVFSAQTVTLTVTDNAGNSSTCQATVTVLDVLNYTETPGLRKASDGLANDNLGWGVGIDGPVAIAGAPNDKVGTQAKQGSAYVFLQNQPSSNNWGQLKQIKSTGGEAVDYFGNAVSIDGNTALVGGYGDNVGTTTDAGSAYVFEKDNGGTNNWGQAAQLSASDFEAYEYFGSSVALKNGIAAVGANKDKIDGKAAQGSVYIFAKSGSVWPQVKKITAHDGAANNFFGNAVSQSNGLLLVGANGNLSNRGAAYLYGQNTGGTNNWGLVKKLTASDAAVGDGFGTSVSLSGDYALAGAPNKATYAGAAYVFKKDQGGAGNWGQVKKLAPADLATNDRFGASVALTGDYAYVTALRGNSDKGAVYVFHKNQGGSENWGQIGKYTAAAGATGDQFGYALGVSGNFMAVGANLDDVDGKADQGAVYFFTGADCPDMPKPTDETTSTTELGNGTAPQVRCQPNPFRDELTIEVSAQGATHLQVTDAAGRLMVEADLPAGATRFDLNSSSFRGGLYFVQVSGENGVRVVPVALVR